jgi:hypothetical protein
MSHPFDRNFFSVQASTEKTLHTLLAAAGHDLDIAARHKDIEVLFHFTYMAFVKIGIYMIARQGYRVKAVPGHHQKIIEAMSRISNDIDMQTIGDRMRKERNLDLYGGDSPLTEADSREFFEFAKALYGRVGGKGKRAGSEPLTK